MDGKTNAQQKGGFDMGHAFPILQRTAPSASTTYSEKGTKYDGNFEENSAFPILMNIYGSSVNLPNKACIPNFYLKSATGYSINVSKNCIIPTETYLKQLMADLGIFEYLTQDLEYVARIGYTTDPTLISNWTGTRGDIRFTINNGTISFVYDFTNFNKIYGNSAVTEGSTIYFFVGALTAVN